MPATDLTGTQIVQTDGQSAAACGLPSLIMDVFAWVKLRDDD